MNINEQKLHALLGKVVSDFGAVFQAPLILIGDSLGLYRAMRDGQPTTPAALAQRTDTAERYVREWLNAHAAAGYVDYHPENGTYSLSPEQSMLFAEEGGPAFLVGAFQAARARGPSAQRWNRRFEPARGYLGTSTTTSSFMVRSASIAPAMLPIWSRTGYRRSPELRSL